MKGLFINTGNTLFSSYEFSWGCSLLQSSQLIFICMQAPKGGWILCGRPWASNGSHGIFTGLHLSSSDLSIIHIPLFPASYCLLPATYTLTRVFPAVCAHYLHFIHNPHVPCFPAAEIVASIRSVLRSCWHGMKPFLSRSFKNADFLFWRWGLDWVELWCSCTFHSHLVWMTFCIFIFIYQQLSIDSKV